MERVVSRDESIGVNSESLSPKPKNARGKSIHNKS
jgi:hypothetical protein